MKATELRLQGLKLITPKVFADSRGFFLETFQQSLYDEAGILERFVQDNHSYSLKGCIRGMHFQSVPGQAKLVRAAVGGSTTSLSTYDPTHRHLANGRVLYSIAPLTSSCTSQ